MTSITKRTSGTNVVRSRRRRGSEGIRESIMASALQVFSEDMVSGARIKRVASSAGIALGTIYNYFESKEHLANVVYRQWKAETERYTVVCSSNASARETFSAWWEKLVAFYTDHPAAFIFLEAHHHSPFLDDESRALATKVDKVAEQAFRSWQEGGKIRRADPRLLIVMVVGVFTALVREAQRTGRALDQSVFDLGEKSAWAMLDGQ
jgi:AcrR family transcriptional regulator